MVAKQIQQKQKTMKKQIALGLICAMITFNVGANTNVDSKSPEIDQNTLENSFNDDSIGINYVDESGMVIIHDETQSLDTLDAHMVEQLIEKTNDIIAENDSEKLTRTIISMMIICIILLSIRNRKKSKNG